MLGQKSEVPHWARPQGWLRYLRRRLSQFNPRPRARRNVAHHYDLDGRLYSLFLDADRQYSCGYFESPEQSLDDAQLAKKRHLAAKLRLEPRRQDLRVLDIGCGWGGLGLYLAEVGGADVTGVTLSQEQHAIANERAAEKGLGERARFNLQDYRDVTGPFDRIVSVGMFEHVGVNHYDTFFRKSAQLLADDGVMVLHSIGRSEGPERHQSVDREIYLPRRLHPCRCRRCCRRSRAPACWSPTSRSCACITPRRSRHWRERFLAHREEVERIYDQRFVRMWEFYLAASEMSFREQNMMVFQIQLTKRQGVVPMTRDYIVPRGAPPARRRRRAPPAAAAGRRIVRETAARRAQGSRRNRPFPPLNQLVTRVDCVRKRSRSRCPPQKRVLCHNFRVSTDIHGPRSNSALRKQVEEPAPLFRSAPHNIEAEQALLGAILVNNEAFYRVSDFLNPEHFFEPIHQKIYQLARDLIRAGKMATPVTLKTFLDADIDIGGLTVEPVSGAARRRSHHHHQCRGLRPYHLRPVDPPRADPWSARTWSMSPSTRRSISRRATRSRTPSAGCTNWPRPAATTAASSASRRRSPPRSTWRRTPSSATASCPASPPASTISTA